MIHKVSVFVPPCAAFIDRPAPIRPLNWKPTMKIRILTPTLHGLLDYAAAAGLIVLPFLLDLGATSALALWLSVAGGVGLIVYSLATDYTFGVLRVLSFRSHLALDLGAAGAFVTAPFVFGWTGLTMAYYLVMAAGVVVVVALSRNETAATDDRTARIEAGSR